MRRATLALTAAGLMLGLAAPVSAYEPVHTVHTERVQAGPYGLTVGFSKWPIRAQQSLDFTFVPDGGLDGKSGTVSMVGPVAVRRPVENMARHPRKREVWGLDIRAVPAPGDWTLKFAVNGPAGQGVGQTRPLTVLDQPGPPFALSWAIGTIPLWGMIAMLVVAWRRDRKRTALSSAATAAKDAVTPLT
jgi:hypothetical protein